MSDLVETVAIEVPKTDAYKNLKSKYLVINKEDFDEKEHKLYKGSLNEPKKEAAEEEKKAEK